jgi:hypothetical protein
MSDVNWNSRSPRSKSRSTWDASVRRASAAEAGVYVESELFLWARTINHQDIMGRDYTGPTLPKTIRDQIGGKPSISDLVSFE